MRKNKLYFAILLISTFSCKKLLEVNLPIERNTLESTYSNTSSASSVMNSIYSDLYAYNGFFFGKESITVFTGLAADEFKLSDLSFNNFYSGIYKNAFQGETSWYKMWSVIFKVNSVIEGVTESKTIPQSGKNQILGEAKFLRALTYFYLVNMYGDLPMVVTTNVETNRNLPRINAAKIYGQIILDLKEAESNLAADYLNGDLTQKSFDRLRPNKFAASALLSRINLYLGDWAGAETIASNVIANSAYKLVDLTETFDNHSLEAIWQVQPVLEPFQYDNFFGTDGRFFILNNGPQGDQPIYLSESLLKNFVANDNRLSTWVMSTEVNGKLYYYPNKYKDFKASGKTTNGTILRLAEQYLIRAEARIQQNKFILGNQDINEIRTRAGLGDTIITDRQALLAEVLKQRQLEFFAEHGNRWFDLKRTGNINAVMLLETPKKGGIWDPRAALFQINIGDLRLNPNLTQNPGYATP